MSRTDHPSGARLAWAALALSGVAGLVEEVCWIRRSALVFGSTTQALSTVVAVFLLGLALGGWAWGRAAARFARPLRACAWIELAAAALVLASLPAFAALDPAYGRAFRALPLDSPALAAVRTGLIALVLLPPTVLMGATLPLFARAMVRTQDRIGRSIAALYAVNTLGGAAGAALAGFALLPRVGMAGGLAFGAALHAAAALLLLRGGARAAEVGPPFGRCPAADHASGGARPASDVSGAAPAWVAALTALAFATGLVALAQEVLWARFLTLVLRSTVKSTALTLTLVLVGIVAGSALASRIADARRGLATAFGGLQVGSALLVAALLSLPPAWWRGLGGELPTAAVLLLPPAILAGASFPLLARLRVEHPSDAAAGLGALLASNTLGGILGAILAGFVVLPGPGLAFGVRATTALSLAAGVAGWLALGGRPRPAALATSVAAALLWWATPNLGGARVPADFLAAPGRLVAWREGLESNLAVVRMESGALALEADRWWQGQDRRTHQVMAAHLPMLLHPGARRVLVVGVGAGQTPARFTMHAVERLDGVDIEPRVFDVLRERYPSRWLEDPRVRTLRADGRNVLAHAAERYDVISLEPGQLFRPGVASFYTLEFYRAARARLRPGGLLSQFVALPFLAPDELSRLIATFVAVFPNATLWYNTSELLLVGSPDRVPALSAARVGAALADSAIAADLAFSLWGGPERSLARPATLAASFLCGPRGLAAMAHGAAPYRDDPPALEYAMSRRRGDEKLERETLPRLAAALDPLAIGWPDAPSETLAAAASTREGNLRDVLATAEIRGVPERVAAGDLAGAEAQLAAARAANPEHVPALRIEGDLRVLEGRMDEAERWYRRALATDPRDPRTHAGLGIVCLRTDRFAEAGGHLRVAIAVSGESAELRNNLGIALGRQGDLAGARAEFERALALDPANVDAARNLDQVRAAAAPAK